jgi:hypothetical protein
MHIKKHLTEEEKARRKVHRKTFKGRQEALQAKLREVRFIEETNPVLDQWAQFRLDNFGHAYFTGPIKIKRRTRKHE